MRLASAHDPTLTAVPKLLLEIRPKGPGTRTVPMLDYIINELSATGFDEIAFVTSRSDKYGDAVADHLIRRPNKSPNLTIIREQHPSGTGWAVWRALQVLYVTDVIVVPGDIIFPFSVLPSVRTHHLNQRLSITWVVTTETSPESQNYRRLLVNEGELHVVQALESSSSQTSLPMRAGTTAATSTGVVVVSRERVLAFLDAFLTAHGRPARFEFYAEFMPWIIDSGLPVGYFDIKTEIYDLGTPERIAKFR